MKKDRRWMKSILAAANEPQAALPWARGNRRRPDTLKPSDAVAALAKPQAVAAR